MKNIKKLIDTIVYPFWLIWELLKFIIENIKDYLIYFFGILLFGYIRYSNFSVGNVWDETINDLAVGAVASTLVALMIKIRDDYSLAGRRSRLKTRISYKIAKDIADYMDEIAILLASCSNMQDDVKHTMDQWNDCLRKSHGALDLYEHVINIKKLIIKKDLENVEKKKEWFLMEKILDSEFIDDIRRIHQALDDGNVFIAAQKTYTERLYCKNKNIIQLLNESETFKEAKLTELEYGPSQYLTNCFNDDVYLMEI